MITVHESNVQYMTNFVIGISEVRVQLSELRITLPLYV